MKLKTGMIAALAFVAWGFSDSAHAALCNIGDTAQVEWKGSWYPAKVLQGGESKCYIHYTGYDSSWDEWVGPHRIRITTRAAQPSAPLRTWNQGDAVQVLWKGTWYPSHVIGVNGSQLKIHYDGYDNSWDEWVGPGRYR